MQLHIPVATQSINTEAKINEAIQGCWELHPNQLILNVVLKPLVKVKVLSHLISFSASNQLSKNSAAQLGTGWCLCLWAWRACSAVWT